MVMKSYFSPARSTLSGNSGWLMESGAYCVSRQKPSCLW